MAPPGADELESVELVRPQPPNIKTHHFACNGCTTFLFVAMFLSFGAVMIGLFDTANQLERTGSKVEGLARVTGKLTSSLKLTLLNVNEVASGHLSEVQVQANQATAAVQSFRQDIENAGKQRISAVSAGANNAEKDARELYKQAVKKLSSHVLPVFHILDNIKMTLNQTVTAVSKNALEGIEQVIGTVDYALQQALPLAEMIADKGGPNVTAQLLRCANVKQSLRGVIGMIDSTLPQVVSSLDMIEVKMNQILASVNDAGAGAFSDATFDAALTTAKKQLTQKTNELGVPVEEFGATIEMELKEGAAALTTVLEAPVLAITTAAESFNATLAMAMEGLDALEEMATNMTDNSAERSAPSKTATAMRIMAVATCLILVVIGFVSLAYTDFLERAYEDREIAAVYGTLPTEKPWLEKIFTQCGVEQSFWLFMMIMDFLTLLMLVIMVSVACVGTAKVVIASGCSASPILHHDETCTRVFRMVEQGIQMELLGGSTCSEADLLICHNVSSNTVPYTCTAAFIGLCLSTMLPRRLIWVRGIAVKNVAVAEAIFGETEQRRQLLAQVQASVDSKTNKNTLTDFFQACNRGPSQPLMAN